MTRTSHPTEAGEATGASTSTVGGITAFALLPAPEQVEPDEHE